MQEWQNPHINNIHGLFKWMRNLLPRGAQYTRKYLLWCQGCQCMFQKNHFPQTYIAGLKQHSFLWSQLREVSLMDLHNLLLSLLCDNRAGSNVGWKHCLVACCPRARTTRPRICVWTLLRSLYFSSEAVNVSVLQSRERCCSSQRLYQGMDTAFPMTECPSSPLPRFQDCVGWWCGPAGGTFVSIGGNCQRKEGRCFGMLRVRWSLEMCKHREPRVLLVYLSGCQCQRTRGLISEDSKWLELIEKLRWWMEHEGGSDRKGGKPWCTQTRRRKKGQKRRRLRVREWREQGWMVEWEGVREEERKARDRHTDWNFY